jgi:hypothetical protein
VQFTAAKAAKHMKDYIVILQPGAFFETEFIVLSQKYSDRGSKSRSHFSSFA